MLDCEAGIKELYFEAAVKEHGDGGGVCFTAARPRTATN